MHSSFTLDPEGNFYFRGRLLGHKSGLSIAAGDVLNGHAAAEDSPNVALAPEPGGDVVWCARDAMFALERKSYDDLVNSRWNGRLADELRRMLTYYDAVFLAVECEAFMPTRRPNDYGVFGGGTRMGLIPDDLQTTLVDWQQTGVVVVYTSSPRHTLAYARKLLKKYATRPTASEPLRQLRRPKTHGLDMLVSIPGIGPASARKLVDRHGSLKNLLYFAAANGEEACRDELERKVWRSVNYDG